ncbi:MAG: hypothetical protein A3E84_02500 [Gammaproteobacteria bacterium RIFCSPHIGHO2_12_FULL_42_13]|nr:MAG: hypothetical protein A3E84_02500 [Gammaproteobacteria bacterium RIFCSPHIGHO2_12_FULL_42_13]
MTEYVLSFIKGYISSYRGLKKACWQGMLLNFIESVFVGVYYFLPLYFISELNINIAIASIIISFYGLGTILGGFLGGKLSDEIGSGLVSIGSLVLQGLAMVILLKLHSVNLIIIDLFFMGVASYAFITSNHLWVLGLCGDDENARLKVINILNVASNLGSGLSAVIIGVLASYSFRNILNVSAGCIFLSAIYFSYLNNSGNKKTYSHVENTEKSHDKVQAAKFGISNNVFYLILVCVFLVGLIIFQMNTTYSLYIKETFPKYGMQGVGFLYALNCFLVVLFQAPIVNVFQPYNKLIMAGVGAFMLGFGMFMLSFSFIFPLAILSCFIYTTGEMLFFSMAQFICYHSGHQNKRGSSLGMYRVVYACSRVIGPAIGGYTFQYLGGNGVWFGCGVIGIFSLLACCYYRKCI